MVEQRNPQCQTCGRYHVGSCNLEVRCFECGELGHVKRNCPTPVSIVSDQDTKFVSKFWQGFQSAMGTELCTSTAFHPQTDGQSERTIQTLEGMLRACAREY